MGSGSVVLSWIRLIEGVRYTFVCWYGTVNIRESRGGKGMWIRCVGICWLTGWCGMNPANRLDVAQVGEGTGGLGLGFMETWGLGEDVDRAMLKMRGRNKYND